MFDEVFAPIEEVAKEVSYWLVRTDSGKYYKYFYSQRFIAIGWNYVSLNDLNNLTRKQIIEKIAIEEGYDLNTPTGLRQASLAMNKIQQFKDLKKGDVVVIPSEESNFLAFGVIEDSGIYTEVTHLDEVEFYKRRVVSWYVEYPIGRLDPIFFKMIHSHHVLSRIDTYSGYIDRLLHSVYKKNGFAHISLEVNTSSDIDVITLVNFMGALQKLTEAINKEFDFNEDVTENSVRLNLQSPGIMEMKLLNGKSLLMLAVILNIMACGHTDNIQGTDKQKEEIERFRLNNQDTLDTIGYGINVMEIDINRFNNIY